jgi:eukaryotic-like serine/threonine-protein kinase
MELVRGIKITDYCDQNQLPTSERLKLFMQVCHAIQHAHQKGIIHRDIKPSNILVTLHDGVPVPKVIDFGIAKATQQELTDKTVFTQFQQFIGTPAYISPEQAEMSGLDIDTRADIYSLGVLLYELLVGQTPFDAKEMMKDGLDALRQIIREKEPLRPSTKLNTLPGEARTTAGKRRHTDVSKLVHQLQGDLDWIVMKCLEKDRTRRYDTANGLAMDIQRHLVHEPIVARPPSATYRAQKLIRRNKLAFAAGAIVTLALIVGTAFSAWQAIRATRAVQAETQQRMAADVARQQAVAAQRAAEIARTNEVKLRHRAELETRRAKLLAYDSDMKLTDQALNDNHLGRARELLDRHRPQAAEEDLRGWEWRYLWQRSRSDELFTFWHTETEEIPELAFSPDGRLLAARIGRNGFFQLFDVTTRSLLTNAALEGKWQSMAFSPRAPLLACSGSDTNGNDILRVLSLPELKPLLTVALEGRLGQLLFSRDGRFLIGAVRGPWELKVWDTERKQFVESFPKIKQSYDATSPKATSSDGQLLAVGSTPGDVRICRLPDGSVEREIKASDEMIMAVAFSPDDRWIASCAGWTDKRVRVWQVADGREIARLNGHGAYVTSLEFLPDGKTLITGSADQTIRFWDVATQRELAVLRGHASEVRGLSYCVATGMLASGGKDGYIKFWRTDSRPAHEPWVRLPAKLKLSPGAPKFSAESLAWSPDSATFAVAEESEQGEEVVQLWDAKRFERLPDACPIQNVRAMVFSPDGRELLLGTKKGLAHSYSRTSHQLSPRQFDLGDQLFTLKYVNEDKQLMVVGFSKLAILEADTWRLIREIALPKMDLCSAEINSSGTRLLRGDWGGSIEFVDTQSGEAIRRNRVFAGSHTAGFAFLSDEHHAAVINSSARSVTIWDTATQTQLRQLRGHLLAGHGAGLSSDGQRLISGSTFPESAKIWDLRMDAMREVVNLKAPGNLFQAVGFSPDGSIVFAIENGGAAYFWRAPSWEEIAAAELKEKTERTGP